jgi:hypothetical protein
MQFAGVLRNWFTEEQQKSSLRFIPDKGIFS